MRKWKLWAGALVLTANLAVSGIVMPVQTVSGMGTVLAAETGAAAERDLSSILQEKEIMATVYLTDIYQVKTSPDAGAATVAEVLSGAQVFIKDAVLQESGVWYLVEGSREEVPFTGYIEGQYLVSSDEAFVNWENSYSEVLYTRDQLLVRSGNEDILQFPESYRAYLFQLRTRHPNWTFVAMNTGLDWNEVIDAQMAGDRSWVHSSKPDAWKGEMRATGWYLATRPAVEYCVDPRNFLTDDDIFMFEQLTYNPGYHTAQAVQNILQNTFMAGQVPEEGITYAQAFFNIGSAMQVSPFHLACRVFQEQGAGTSPLISGTYPGFEGFYNYFNVNASGNTNEQVYTSGLTYARNQGWNTRMRALSGGADVVSKNYIRKGQDTLYLQKFHVENSYYPLYTHQYMQNISAPKSEGVLVKRAYTQTGALENPFVFKIPVYENMPAAACPEPTDALEQEKEAQLRAFVVRLYELALGRSCQESEVDFWCEQLKSGKSTGADAAWGFFFSEELKNRNVSDERFVDLLYNVMFNRTGDPDGKATWMEKLANGMRREYVYQGFANATEFTTVCNSYGVVQGSIVLDAYRDKNEGVTAFVHRLYNKVLGRNGDDAGMENWCRTIIRGDDTAENVAYGFVFSDEFLKKNVSDRDYVDIMYRTFLDRAPDEAGYQDWTGHLARGMSRVDVFRGFARSVEFKELMKKYGVL